MALRNHKEQNNQEKEQIGVVKIYDFKTNYKGKVFQSNLYFYRQFIIKWKRTMSPEISSFDMV